MTKPFSPAELLAHLRALTRRQGEVVFETLRAGDLELNLELVADLACNAKSIPTLSYKEFSICRILLANPGQVVSKDLLIAKVWGVESSAEDNNVEAYISFLRKKFAFLGSEARIETLRKAGYRFMSVASTRRTAEPWKPPCCGGCASSSSPSTSATVAVVLAVVSPPSASSTTSRARTACIPPLMPLSTTQATQPKMPPVDEVLRAAEARNGGSAFGNDPSRDRRQAGRRRVRHPRGGVALEDDGGMAVVPSLHGLHRQRRPVRRRLRRPSEGRGAGIPRRVRALLLETTSAAPRSWPSPTPAPCPPGGRSPSRWRPSAWALWPCSWSSACSSPAGRWVRWRGRRQQQRFRRGCVSRAQDPAHGHPGEPVHPPVARGQHGGAADAVGGEL